MGKKKIKPLTGNAGDFSGIVLKAAARGDAAAVRHYLGINPEWLNQEGPHGRTLLWEAAYKGRTELIRELITLGADVNPLGSYYTPMLVELSAIAVARAAGHDKLVALLEEHGAADDLYAACHRGDLNTVDRFLAGDPDAVNRPARDVAPHPRMGYHPVHYAVAGKQTGVLRLLAGYGADIDSHLPLLLDWSDGDRALIQCLREHASPAEGADSDCRDKMSIANVPAVDRPDWMGFPPLVDACRGNHNAPDDPDRVRRLLQRGANVNIIDHKGKTPLHRAAQAGFLKITRLLLKHGAALEIADLEGQTPVFDAARHGRTKALALLIKRGANVHHTDNRGETPLFASARGSEPETFALLLTAGCAVDHRDHRDRTVVDFVGRSRTLNPGRVKILELADAAPTGDAGKRRRKS